VIGPAGLNSAFKSRFAAIVLSTGAVFAFAQEPSALETARQIDRESRQLKDAPDSVRAPRIRQLALRIRALPAGYALALAHNLVIDHTDLADRDSLQNMADTLAHVLLNAPEEWKDKDPGAYRDLAELALLDHLRVPLNDVRYRAALRQLKSEAEQRRRAGFTLTDLDGKQWSLSSLRGKVVLINFWAHWCPPCRKELSDFRALYARFGTRGLVVLTIPVMYEELDPVRQFVTEQKMEFPVLLDPGHKIQELFHVKGVPANFLYDRSGRLVRERFRTAQDFVEGLGQAGLR
jgi:peroxiredoxin